MDDPPTTVCYFIIYGNEDEIFHLDSETHILTIQKELDREIKPNYTLFVRATENCSVPPKPIAVENESDRMREIKVNTLSFTRRTNATRENAFDRFKYSRNLRSARDTAAISSSLVSSPAIDEAMLMQDSTVVRVTVYVQDINDNPPKFISRIFTGGITTNANFGTKFMEVQVIVRLISTKFLY